MEEKGLSKKEKMFVLNKVAEYYTTEALSLRASVSGLVIGVQTLYGDAIPIEMINKMFFQINEQINKHYESIEELSIKHGINPEEAMNMVGEFHLQKMSFDEFEKGESNGK